MHIKENFRERVIIEFYRTLCGPYYGKFEVIPLCRNPQRLYLSGVLAPIYGLWDEDVEEKCNNEGDSGEDDFTTQDEVDNPLTFVTALDSKSRPQSFGVSFLATTNEEIPSFDVCITWARYLWAKEWIEIKKSFDEKGIELIGPMPNICLKGEDAFDIGKGDEKEEGKDSFIIDVEDPEKDQIIKNLISAHQQIQEEKSAIDPQKIGAWFRDPRYVILEDVKLPTKDGFYHFRSNELENIHFFNIVKSKLDDDMHQISFQISEIGIFQKKKVYRISVYFINKTPKYEEPEEEGDEDKTKDKTKDEIFNGKYVESYLFQPQIRIHLNEGTENIPYEFNIEPKISDNITWGSEDYERLNLKMLYRNKKPFARGHMCSAIWKNIDPERSCTRTINELKKVYNDQIPESWKYIEENDYFLREISEKFPPFYWLDGEVLNDDKLFNKFCVSDIRTEFIPIYPIISPNFDWKENISTGGLNEFLRPEIIAEQGWNSYRLDDIFNPLLEKYEKWIEEQRNEIAELGIFKNIGEINLNKHDQVLNRMKDGLEILKGDINARMSFCFANKAIIHQYEMSGKSTFPWRPFQIAFLLMSIRGIIEAESNEEFPFNSDIDHDIVDLIWIPTGGGKTEAYLLTAAFTIAYRRRKGIELDKASGTHFQLGVNIISRYTLRLLTIQQFRRGLKFIMSCELLRLDGMNNQYNQTDIIGWLPNDLACLKEKESPKKAGLLADFPEFKNFIVDDWIWGGSRFSIGLWIGGKMTPNRLRPLLFTKPITPGAIDALKVYSVDANNNEWFNVREGDPAQVIQCPSCNTYLSLPKKLKDPLPNKELELYLIIRTDTQDEFTIVNNIQNLIQENALRLTLSNSPVQLSNIYHFNDTIFILELKFDFRGKNIDNKKLRDWWKTIETTTNYELLAADVLNPGYFILKDPVYKCKDKFGMERACEYDFEIRCLNPKCIFYTSNYAEKNIVKSQSCWTEINPLFQLNDKGYISRGIPIHAFTVDEQIYRRIPTMLIGTVDKFAQIAYNDAIGSIFGNVERFHLRHGFTRKRVDLYSGIKRVNLGDGNWIDDIDNIPPPEIILQDELHLIEGPLGSYVGIYEIAIDNLCLRKIDKTYIRPKYIASTATIAAGSNQIQSLYTRKFILFPPPGLKEDDCFFQRFEDLHPLEEAQIGRLYLGLATPGKSSQTTLARAYGSFLNTTFQINKDIRDNITVGVVRNAKIKEIDRFWTIVGFFNTIKELARMRSVCNQDLREWILQFYGLGSRKLPFDRNDPVELSSRTDSVILPMYLKNLDIGLIDDQTNLPNDPTSVTNIVLTTSMFGTGVDVPRLGLMVIDGQPKTTGQYIQTSGRIGRRAGGIILTFLHAGRPRDLDHYEQFVGYHRAIYRYIEPSTVSPFAPNCLETTLGPISVAILRQAKDLMGIVVDHKWRGKNEGPKRIIREDPNPRKIEVIRIYKQLIENRHDFQPETHKLLNTIKQNIFDQYDINIERWHTLISANKKLWYSQFLSDNLDQDIVSVILGDPQHQYAEMEGIIDVIFKNAPNSLRGVEPTICLGIPYKDE